MQLIAGVQFLFRVMGAILMAIVHVYLIVVFALIAAIALLFALVVPWVIKAKQ
jgi:hypothetical protein